MPEKSKYDYYKKELLRSARVVNEAFPELKGKDMTDKGKAALVAAVFDKIATPRFYLEESGRRP